MDNQEFKEFQEYYDVNYEVKYNFIKEELLKNMEINNQENNQENNEENNYTINDIDSICYKLYLDEYSSVFKSDNFMDDKIDITTRKVFELLMKNKEFKNYINNMTISYLCGSKNYRDDFEEKELVNELDENMSYFSFLSLFDIKLFHLTHQFISHYIKTNAIDRDMFEKIKHLNDVILKK
jgi:hypothetical protein